jgi:hypothetical protein
LALAALVEVRLVTTKLMELILFLGLLPQLVVVTESLAQLQVVVALVVVVVLVQLLLLLAFLDKAMQVEARRLVSITALVAVEVQELLA